MGADASCCTESTVDASIGKAKRGAPLRRTNPADSGPGTSPAHFGSLGFHSTPLDRAGGFVPLAGLCAGSATTFARRKRTGRAGLGQAGLFAFGIGMPIWSN